MGFMVIEMNAKMAAGEDYSLGADYQVLIDNELVGVADGTNKA
jgi:hypothetical protein